MILTYRYRLLPTKRQHCALAGILESQRQLYNAALEERIDAYRKARVRRTLFDQYLGLTEWRRTDSEGAALPAALQRWTLKRLDDACRAFFTRTNVRFPRFRGKGRFDTFGFRQMCGIRFDNGRIRFKGMPGSLRVHLHRTIPADACIRSCTLHRDVKGWFVGLDLQISERRLRRGHRAVGVDLGITRFAAFSDGGFVPSLRAARRAERRLNVLHRALNRKAKASNGRRKARATLARCHGAVRRARANHLHQASARLVREYDVIVVEKLEVSGLARGVLAKHIYDASWAKFLGMVRYKAECAGSRLIEVDPYDTSQECSGCGARAPKKLSDRIHECPNCGLAIDRDLNAARNILHRAGVSPGLLNVADTACVQAEILATTVASRN